MGFLWESLSDGARAFKDPSVPYCAMVRSGSKCPYMGMVNPVNPVNPSIGVYIPLISKDVHPVMGDPPQIM